MYVVHDFVESVVHNVLHTVVHIVVSDSVNRAAHNKLHNENNFIDTSHNISISTFWLLFLELQSGSGKGAETSK